MTAHFDNDDFQFGLEIALGCAYRQASDVGEVLATAERIKDGDDDAWVREWTATAGACWASAQEAEAGEVVRCDRPRWAAGERSFTCVSPPRKLSP